METEEILNDLQAKMSGTIGALTDSLKGLRAGRASTSLLEPIKVEVYGNAMSLNHIATVTAPEARSLAVQVWDKTNVANVVNAIRDSNLGLNPISEGLLIRIPMPELTTERRRDMVKKAQEYAENSKISIRNIRRGGMDTIKKQEKEKLISEDEMRDLSTRIQKLTDDFIKKVSEISDKKSAEILN